MKALKDYTIWHNYKKKQPKKGDFLACYRLQYPAFYWMGFWEDRDQEDEPDFWMLLPKPLDENWYK